MKAWIQHFKNWVMAYYRVSEVHQSPENIDPKSITIDFEDHLKIKRFIVWDDFSCVYESININSEKTEILKREEFHSVEQLKDIFDHFYNS